MVQELQNATVVTSQISVKGEDKGTIALIGPKRMEYDRVVTLLNYIKENIEEVK